MEIRTMRCTQVAGRPRFQIVVLLRRLDDRRRSSKGIRLNPYETTPSIPTQDEPESTGDNTPGRTWNGTKALMLALAGGTTALLGLVLGICGVLLIVANVSTQGRIEVWAIIAFPIAIIAVVISVILLMFGLLGVRDACRQYSSGRKILR